MGLDMYLYEKVSLAGWEEIPYEDQEDCLMEVTVKIATKGGKPKIKRVLLNNHDATMARVNVTGRQVAYWRKANQIHKWFVDNIQNGNDDCKEYELTGADLKRLIRTCKKVLEDHNLAQELLPTSEGFFFGSNDYDKYYYEDLKETIRMLEEIDFSDEQLFEYHSSW